MIVVTHEMAFAREVADWVVYMDEGRIVEVDRPSVIYGNPANERMREFLQRVLEPDIGAFGNPTESGVCSQCGGKCS